MSPTPSRPAVVGAATRPRVCVTGLSSDAHTWNLIFVQLLLEELGCDVVNLGPCVPDEEIAEHCLRHDPDLLVVSSVNGHGEQDGMSLIRHLRGPAGLARLPTVIGGKLRVDGGDSQVSARLTAAGFDAVFDEASGLTAFTSFVRALPSGASCAPT